MSAQASLRQRLSQALLIASLAWAALVAAAVGALVHHEVDERLDSALQEAAEILYGVLARGSAVPLGEPISLPAPPHVERLVWQIVEPSRGVALRSHDAPQQALDPRALGGVGARGFSGSDAGWRVYALPLPQATAQAPGRTLLVAQRGNERHATRTAAVAATVAVAVLAVLPGWWWLRGRVRRELQPVEALSAAVARFDPLGHEALAAPQREELQPLRDAVAALGARLARRVAAERAFAAHAAHALRTPLAGLVAQLAVAQRSADEAARPPLDLARQAADRLRGVVGALLALFRAGGEPQRQPVEVAALLADLPVQGLHVACEPGPALAADPDLLAAALLNLLDNALRAGAGAVQVTTEATARGGGVLTLRDDGPGWAAGQAEALQAVLDAQAYEGHQGLGLVLADLVARAHGGRLRLLQGDADPHGGRAGAGLALELGPPPRA